MLKLGEKVGVRVQVGAITNSELCKLEKKNALLLKTLVPQPISCGSGSGTLTSLVHIMILGEQDHGLIKKGNLNIHLL